MKKVLTIVAIIMLLAAPLFAQDYVRGSGQQTADALIVTGPGVFHGIIVSTDSTNAVTVNVYDGITATGTRLLPEFVVTTSSTDRIQAIKPPGGPALFYTGLYVDITCSGTAKYVVYFK
jgi:hypothetical protein